MSFLNKLMGGMAALALGAVIAAPAFADQYLVVGSGGPGFSSPQEALRLLEGRVLPTFKALEKLKADKKILAGGMPVGDRAFVFILDAASNEEAGRIVRDIPLWPSLTWKVTPLQSIAGRAKKERRTVRELKKRIR
jgi:hypothetical protein